MTGGQKALYTKEHKVRGGSSRWAGTVPSLLAHLTGTPSLILSVEHEQKQHVPKGSFFNCRGDLGTQRLTPPDRKSVIPEVPHGKTSYQLAAYFYCGELVKFVGLFIAAASCATTQFSPVQFSCSVVSGSLQPHGLQHARPPCPSPNPRAYSNPCPWSR